jgi:hypothetical protein
MGKPEIIQHLINMAERDWKSVLTLERDGQFVHTLFFHIWL